MVRHSSVPESKETEARACRTTLAQCFKIFEADIDLKADVYCSQCKAFRKGSKRTNVWKVPNVLIVKLNRFIQAHDRDKIDTYVKFPIKGLDISASVGCKGQGSSYVYDLFAVLNHFSEIGGGHFVANVQSLQDKKWYICDDNSINQCNTKDLVTKNAYILFYVRRGIMNFNFLLGFHNRVGKQSAIHSSLCRSTIFEPALLKCIFDLLNE